MELKQVWDFLKIRKIWWLAPIIVIVGGVLLLRLWAYLYEIGVLK